MLGEIDGYCPNSSGFWFSRSHGSWPWLFRFLRLANDYQNHRSSRARNEKHHNTVDRSITPLDQDMIRLQQKVNTVLELKEEHKLKDPNEKHEGTQKKENLTQYYFCIIKH